MENDDIFYVPEKPEQDEFFKILFKHKNIIVEKIVSYGIPSPAGFWYEQEEYEWLTVLTGEAIIKYRNGKIIKLIKGNTLYIPPMKKHRVEKVSNPCIWLTIKGK